MRRPSHPHSLRSWGPRWWIVFVVAAVKEFKLLRTIPMGDEGDDRLRSVVAVADGNLFIRTGSKLYCIGK